MSDTILNGARAAVGLPRVDVRPRLDPENDGRSALSWLGPPEIFGPLPAINVVCADLDIGVGAPTMVAGFGYSMKTLALQSFALSVAAGLPAWGHFPVREKATVAHFDGEQGRRLTCDRYQRLARGLGVDGRALGDRLRVTVMPRLRLDDRSAVDVLAHELDAVDVALFDSFRAFVGLDENSSEVRQPLDMLGHVSERTGCAIIVIHHARKPSKDAPGGARMSVRGSGAIYDACSSVLVFGGSKGEPVTVQHEKARTTGQPHADFRLSAADVDGPGGEVRWGLKVAADLSSAPRGPRTDRWTEVRNKVVSVLRTTPGLSKNRITAMVGAGKGTVLEVVDHLVEQKEAVFLGGGYRLTGAKP